MKSIRRFTLVGLSVTVLLLLSMTFYTSATNPPATDHVSVAPASDRPGQVTLVEKINLLGDNSSDISIRACTARQKGSLAREAAEAALLREYDSGSARNVFGRGGASVQSITDCSDGSPVSIAVADLDGDSLPEIVTHRLGGQTDIDWNNGGVFTRSVSAALTDAYPVDKNSPVWGGGSNTLPASGAQDLLRSIAVADANDDGQPDIVLLPSTFHTELRVLILDGTRSIPEQALEVPTQGLPGVPDSVVTDDVNRDGIADLLFAVRTNLATYENQPVYAVRYLESTGGQAPYYRERTTELMPRNAPLAGQPLGPTDPIRSNRQVQPTQPFALSVADYDNDEDLDIYVAGDMGGSLYYRNDNGTWVEDSDTAGVLISGNGMGARSLDMNGDGALDIISSENSYGIYRCPYLSTGCQSNSYGNLVLINNQDGSFSDKGEDYGPLRHTGRAWGFSSTDLNADGYLDFFFGNGEIAVESTQPEWEGAFNKPYLLLGGPQGWVDHTADIWRDLSMPGTSVMVASADLDGDMLPDLLVSGRESSAPYVLMNRSTSTGNTALLLVRGAGSGASPRFGEGSVITVEIPGRPAQMFTLPGFLTNYKVQSTNTPIPIGLGDAETALVTVKFPSKRSVRATITAGHLNVIEEPR